MQSIQLFLSYVQGALFLLKTKSHILFQQNKADVELT